MAAKNRRTKRKNSSDNSNDDTSSDDDEPIFKKYKNTSFVMREKEKQMKKIKSVLNSLCDSDEDNGKHHRKNPFATIADKCSKKDSLLSENSSEVNTDEEKKDKRSKNKFTKKKSKDSSIKKTSSESDSPVKETNIKRKIVSKENKTTISGKIINSENESDTSSSKEFQKPKLKKKKKLDDCSVLPTPTKSDDENIMVEKKHEISLKDHIAKEIEKMQNMVEDLKSDFETNKDYLTNKKVKVVRDSKFIAHKILRMYESTYKRLRAHRNHFADTYKTWLQKCSESKSSPTNTSSRKRYQLYDSSDNEFEEREKEINSENTDHSIKDDDSFIKTRKKTNKSCEENNKKLTHIPKNANESPSQNSNKNESLYEKSKNNKSPRKNSESNDSSSKSSKRNSSEKSFEKNKQVDSPKKTDENKNKKKGKKINVDKDIEDKSEDKMNESSNEIIDSEEIIFESEEKEENNSHAVNSNNSNDDSSKLEAFENVEKSMNSENKVDKDPKTKDLNLSKNLSNEKDSSVVDSKNQKTPPTTMNKSKSSDVDDPFDISVTPEENATSRIVAAPISDKLNESDNCDSEELFDSTQSEIANTPVRSPILSISKRTLRQTLLMSSKSLIESNAAERELSTALSLPPAIEGLIPGQAKEAEVAEEVEEAEEEKQPASLTPQCDDSEAEAKKKLFQDSDSSLYDSDMIDEDKKEKKNKSSELDIATGDSDCSTVAQSNRDAPQKMKKITKKNNKVLMQTKKRIILSPDSSSDSSEETRVRKKKSTKDSDDLPLRNRRCRQTFNVLDNPHYKADKKLRMIYRVELERLSQSVLEKYSRSLEKSKAYIAKKKFHSLTNIDGLEIKKKSKKNVDTDGSISDTENRKSTKAKKKSKKDKKSDKIHLNEENDVESDADTSNKLNDETQKSLSSDIPVEQEMNNETENEAKQALLLSSSSNSENEENKDAMEVDEKNEKQKLKKKKIKTTEQDELVMNLSDDTAELDQNDDEKNEKSDWKQDKLLNFRLSDSELEEENFKKSQENKKTQNNENDDKSADEVDDVTEKSAAEKPNKKSKKQRKSRRILDSDSDVKIETSEEESNISDEDADADNDEEKKEKKKKGRKRRQKSSDSDDTSSSEKKPKSKRKRIKKVASDSDSDKDSPGKGRKNIRKVLKDKHVAEDTKKAAQIEEERLRRIAERQRIFNEMYDAKLAGEVKVDKLVLDFDKETKKELIVADSELVKRLKPHQAQGIKFMWEACFESLEQIGKSEGSGCIIAHCMGLGKTFQVVTLTHTLLSHEETGVRTVMIVCPLSTVLNWVNEFKMWLKHTKNGDDIDVYELTKTKKNIERKYQLERWQKTGGVLIIGYEMFRNLTCTGKKMRKAMQESITRALVDPGADLVVCDEGHLLKNEDSALSKSMKLVRTMRRIVLTGTPLQNNLKEYHCMVQFVKPNLLGTKKEFLNRFVNPITNGQFDDSTPYDVKLMKKRAHVLHKKLEGCVQRFDYSVLTPFLPPKQEYVIFVRLTDVQIKMYQHYLDNFARKYGGRNGSLFADFQELQRIWTHPYVLRLNAEKIDRANEKKRLEASDSEGSLKDFIDDDDSESEVSASDSDSGSNSDVQCVDSENEKRPVKLTRSARMNLKEELQEEVPTPQATTEEQAWWSKYLEEKHFEDLRISTKLKLLFGILHESEQIGDKVLVFSQSLYSLTLIEYFLNLIDQETQNGVESELLDNHTGSWSLGLDYFRLDGSTSAENRSIWCKIFNNPNNTRARLFLISTRAGGLGINLTAANRVIIFDASWNPSHDVQSIFRVYRFGQKKPCYIYRFLAAGTMEEKIYNRQVTKLSLACRVVDEQQIERHYSNNDLAELYQFETYEDKSITLNLPKDRLLAEIFLRYKDSVYTYHEHDSLLENKEEEELDEEERKQAWLEYEEESQGKRQMMNVGMNNMMGFNQMLMNMNNFPELESIKLLIQKDYPTLPPEHLETVARQAVYDMYRFVENQSMAPYAATGQMQPGNMFGAAPMTQQQQTIMQQNQLMNMMNQPQQMNYAGVNHMPVYSGRGRPPKHLSNTMYNVNMRQTPMQTPLQSAMQLPLQTPMLPQQPQMQNQQTKDEVEVLSEKQVAPPNNEIASNVTNKED